MKGLHIILLAEGKEMVKHMRLSHRITLILLIIGIMTFVSTSVFVKNYLKLKKKVAKAEQTAQMVKLEESAQQKEQLLSLAMKLQEITENIKKITEVEELALDMMKGKKVQTNDSMLGIGGSDSSPLDVDKLLEINKEELLKRINASLTEMEQKVSRLEASKKEFKKYLESQNIRVMSIPSAWPVQGQISSPFGWRESPFSEHKDFHKGVDIRAPYGSPVKAPADGVVKTIGYHPDFGRFVEIDHKNGFVTKYAHLSKVLVAQNAPVKKGERIGLVGTTGNSTGPHLHYEVIYKGAHVNPKPYLGGSINLLLGSK